MIDLTIKQSWLEKSSETALEAFKAGFVTVLNDLPSDRYADKRWDISRISEGDSAYLVYDERPVVSLTMETNGAALRITSEERHVPRYDDLMYALRFVAQRLNLAVYSNVHGGARLPQDYVLSLDHSIFARSKPLADFFEQSSFIPRFAPVGLEDTGGGRQAAVIYAPYYAEHKRDDSVHILNNALLDFLLKKDDQRTNKEFSYRVADSMHDFARKYDLGLVPKSFYQNYGATTKIINDTYFDIRHITRKVFIDPYVWEFSDEHDSRYYKNVENGLHLMDKVRRGEDLDTAVKRLLREELQVADDYVGLRVWGIEFDRDREGVLTPRLRMNIFVHGMAQKHRSQSHDWVSLR